MKFPPLVTMTSEIEILLKELNELKVTATLKSINADMSRNLRRQTILKSSLYSARIEGNPLEMVDLEGDYGGKDIHKLEIGNLVMAYEKLPETGEKLLNTELICQWHRWTMAGLSGEAGHVRGEDSAIFNEAGVAVYIAPAHQEVMGLLRELCEFVNANRYPGPVVAGAAHIWFEKIHPFLDGNGRVGRLLLTWILRRSGYDFGGLVAIEEYLDEHRGDYYAALAVDKQEVSGFIGYFLAAIVVQVRVSLARTIEQVIPRYPGLLPRRAEIVEIITDHKMVSFDFLRRRFRGVAERTLHYDLSQLANNGYVEKLGTTKGVMYALGGRDNNKRY